MLPADSPKLPLWPFLTGDAALLGLAWIIANESRNPFTGTPLIAIVSCVGLGALLCVYPILVNDVRRQEEALDDRQRSLDALARTVTASAEQISIAANGLHEITELAQRNLKAADQLPQKLQEKIAAFKAQLDSANADDRDELEKEVATLRAAEGERLETASDKIGKAVAEFARLESSAQKHLAASIAALAAAEAKLTAAAALTEANLNSQLAALGAVRPAAGESGPKAEISSFPPWESSRPAAEPAATPATPSAGDSQSSDQLLAAILSGQGFDVKSETPASTPDAAPASPPPRKRAPRKPKAESAVPAPAPENSAEAATGPTDTPAVETVAPLVAASASEPEVEVAPPESVEPKPEESAVSSDGATRLIVTAYIGIGNRLFIRGHGPGLSWDKGVPLQFVSIGKWRWETSDAASPVEFKLYKNDDTECTALGARTIATGQQQEVTATF